MISISSVYPRPATRAASFPKNTSENRPQNNTHFGAGGGDTFQSQGSTSSAVATTAKTLPLDTSEKSIAELVQHAAKGNLSEVKKMVNSNVDVNKPNRDDWTPLQIAANHNHPVMVRYLVSAGADINQENKDGKTPLWLAAQQHNLESLVTLVELGADVNKPAGKGKEGKDWGSTPLWILANNPDENNLAEAMARVLIKANPDLNIPSEEKGTTPMQAATRSGKPRIAQLLREHGATDVDARLRREAYWAEEHASTFRALARYERGEHHHRY